MRPITRCFSVGGRNLTVKLSSEWAEVYLYCGDTLRLIKQVPRQDLPSDPGSATDILIAPFKARATNRPLSREDLAWAMRQRLLIRLGISPTKECTYLVRWGLAIPTTWANALDIAALWRIRRHLQSPQPHPELWGLRSWSFDGQVLRSYTRGTPWPTPILQAHDLDTSSIVEGRAGIHAFHALSASTTYQALYAGAYVLATRGYFHIVWGLVRPYGKIVLGTNGWRSEFAQIMALMTLDSRLPSVLSERYEVPCFLFPNFY